MINTVKIALLEHKQDDFLATSQTLKSIFEDIGLEVDITDVSVDKQKITNFHLSPIFAKAFDVFVTDLSIGDTTNLVGLTYCSSIKMLAADILTVGITRQEIKAHEVYRSWPPADILLEREQLLGKGYKANIRKEVAAKFKKSVVGNIDSSSIKLPIPSDKKTDRWFLTFPELHRALRSLYYIQHPKSLIKETSHIYNNPKTIEHDSKLAISDITVKKLDGGFSASQVFVVAGSNGNGMPCVPSVLKLSAAKDAAKEYTNYKQYIEWHLPSSNRPYLKEFIDLGRTAGICYSFVSERDDSISSSSKLIKDSNYDRIKTLIESIFNPKNQVWYAEQWRGNSLNLSEYYSEKLFDTELAPNCSKLSEESFNNSLSDVDLSRLSLDKLIKVSNAKEVRHPKSILWDTGTITGISCVCHGDLHSDNIIVPQNENHPSSFFLIDFQNTGKGHCYEDFVTFETSLRLLSPDYPDSTMACMLEYESNIGTQSDSTKVDLVSLIKNVRAKALKNFPTENSRHEYHYALCAFSYRMIRLKAIDITQKRRLAACILHCCDILAQPK